jgi:hypothetical protein
MEERLAPANVLLTSIAWTHPQAIWTLHSELSNTTVGDATGRNSHDLGVDLFT